MPSPSTYPSSIQAVPDQTRRAHTGYSVLTLSLGGDHGLQGRAHAHIHTACSDGQVDPFTQQHALFLGITLD